MPYRFLEGLTMADIAFEASGKTLEELFVSAANAVTNTQIEDLKQIKMTEEKEFGLEAVSEERLLHDFLQELIFFKDSELLLFREYELKMVKAAKGYGLIVKARGEKLDPKKHTLLADVKAVSWHMFKLEKTKAGWKATVIIDV
ncbi:archease [Candidatus Micrarchaeota archaeon]|nr:archease [Candidatus Micrarchaeota archaeon]